MERLIKLYKMLLEHCEKKDFSDATGICRRIITLYLTSGMSTKDFELLGKDFFKRFIKDFPGHLFYPVDYSIIDPVKRELDRTKNRLNYLRGIISELEKKNV